MLQTSIVMKAKSKDENFLGILIIRKGCLDLSEETFLEESIEFIKSFMRDTIADTNFSISISIYIYTTLQYKEEKCLICKEIKNREIFLHASSLEQHIKALLPAFGAILAIFAFTSKKAKNLDNNKQMEISKALIDIVLIPFDKDEVKKISHQPVSKSKLVELISLTKEFLPDELKKIYDEILNHINKPYNKR